MDLDNLLANRDMWDFQLRLSSTKTPKNMVSETRGDSLLVYENMKFKQLVFLNTIKLVLDRFRESRFAANQVDNLFSSLFNVSLNILGNQGHYGR